MISTRVSKILTGTVIITLIVAVCLCNSKNTTHRGNNAREEKQALKVKKKSSISLPAMNQQFVLGETVNITVSFIDTVHGIDSVNFFASGKKIHIAYEKPYTAGWQTSGTKVGENKIRTVSYYFDRTTETNHVSIILLSDIVPKEYSYSIQNIYPHDKQAYTQGLIYANGYLFEGTGQYNESSLRQIEISTGQVLRLLNLPGDIFGEGITIFRNKIYQLTYKSQVGFVYDKETFNRIQKVYYQNKEGWGLTHNGEQLIMSDGSHRIYFMDPDYFTETDRIEVYNNQGPVEKLNELEYIQGKIFANIYGSDEIVVIDPHTGRVTGKLIMKGLLTEGDKHNRIDVFNGIAYDEEGDRLFVTGKYWPKLFEIKLLSDI